MKKCPIVLASVGALSLLLVTSVGAAEVRLICSNALQSVMVELGPQFEKATGHQLVITYGSTGPLKAQIEKGAAFDLTILGPAAIDDLTKQGKLAAATRVEVARSGMGVAIRKGASKPDLGSTEAFKRALLQAKSIAFSSSISGVYLSTELFQKLGIADQVLPKSKRIEVGRVGAAVARGEAEIGFQQKSELVTVPGIEYVGPLPEPVQRTTVFAAGIVQDAKNAAGAKRLIEFLAGPSARPAILRSGLDPVR